MASRREAENLRRELDSVPVRRGTCFRRDLKQRAAKWIAERRAGGESVDAIAAELGLAPGTVLRWSNGEAGSGRKLAERRMAPVKVVPEPSSQSLSIVSPAGFRIEGLSLAEATALLRALG